VERCAGPSARPSTVKPNKAERLTEIPPLIPPSPKKLADLVGQKSRSGKGKARPKTTPAEAPARVSSPPGRPAPAVHRPPVESPPTIPMSSADLPPWALQSLTEQDAVPPPSSGWKPLVNKPGAPAASAPRAEDKGDDSHDDSLTEMPHGRQAGRRR